MTPTLSDSPHRTTGTALDVAPMKKLDAERLIARLDNLEARCRDVETGMTAIRRELQDEFRMDELEAAALSPAQCRSCADLAAVIAIGGAQTPRWQPEQIELARSLRRSIHGVITVMERQGNHTAEERDILRTLREWDDAAVKLGWPDALPSPPEGAR